MKKKILKVVKYLLILIMILALINIFIWYKENQKVKKIVSSVSEYLVLDDDGYHLKEEEIKKENEETIGWIKIKGTRIDYPVVQAKDNDFYLTHDYYKKKNSAGWIFMDYRNKLDDSNLIIYGHHRKDDSMFGDLDKLFDKKFYDDNDGKLILIVGEEEITFEVFSVYSLEAKDVDFDPNYRNIEELRKKSLINFNKSFGSGEGQIITLITCHNNNKDRLIVHGFRSF